MQHSSFTSSPHPSLSLQDLMKSAPDVTNVVEACAEGRQERLDSMLQQLELCEKALQVR